MRYWIQDEKTNKWVRITDHDDKHIQTLKDTKTYHQVYKPVETLTADEIDQIMRNQSWEGIK